jgi:hypothetical protein
MKQKNSKQYKNKIPDEISIDIKKFLRFFDEKPLKENKEDDTNYRHTTAINILVGEDLGIALLSHYFKQQRNSKLTLIDRKCTTGKKKGPRLDCWMVEEKTKKLYQVEIKVWSVYSLGGKPLGLEEPKDKIIKQYKKEQWQRIWDDEEKTFKEKLGVKKVLDKMKPPENYDKYKINPILCLWTAMHPEGKKDPFFVKNVSSEYFKCVAVFSMSSYLRHLWDQGKRSLKLRMEYTAQRFNWISNLFPNVVHNQKC